MITMMIFNTLSNLGAFGIGTFIMEFTALIISTIDSEEYGLKPYTTDIMSMLLWCVSFVGSVFFIGGRGILW